MDSRQQRGITIAATCKIDKKGGIFLVPSQSADKLYEVNIEAKSCNCPDSEAGHTCKHWHAVMITLKREYGKDGAVTETRTVTVATQRKTYPQNWPAYNRAQCGEKAKWQILLADLCRTIPEPAEKEGKPGPKRFSLADIVFSATFKTYSTFSGRRFMTDLKEAHAKGYTSKLLHYNSIFRYLEMPALAPILKSLVVRSALPLKLVEQDFAVDATGFATSTYARWIDEKYGREKKARTFIKAHLMCGVRTNVVTAVQIDGWEHTGDYPNFAPLVETTAKGFELADVLADKAYLGNSNLELVDRLGGEPFIPFKVNSGPGEGGSVWNRLFGFWMMHREAYLSRYAMRNNAESTVSAIKRKLSHCVRSKSEAAQVNEVFCKVLGYNLTCLIHETEELGIGVDFKELAGNGHAF